jgi:drug/metabolite transporter (DMT)-like permease
LPAKNISHKYEFCMSAAQSNSNSTLLTRFAPALFILIWSSGYVVAKAAAPYADALTFLLWRYAGVVLLMLALALIARAKWPSRRDMLHLAVAGIGIQAIYLGGVWVAIRHGMPAGVAALIVNLQPVLTAALAVFVHERVSSRQWVGIALGFVGVLLVVANKLGTQGMTLTPVLLCLGSLLGMTLATLYQKRFVSQFDLRTGQVVQFVAAFAVTLPFMWLTEQGHMEWNSQVIAAMLWSIVVLTGGGISLMFFMLREGQATRVTGLMYLVPSVTALMAWLMFNEKLSIYAIFGMIVTLLGVYLVVKKSA